MHFNFFGCYDFIYNERKELENGNFKMFINTMVLFLSTNYIHII